MGPRNYRRLSTSSDTGLMAKHTRTRAGLRISRLELYSWILASMDIWPAFFKSCRGRSGFLLGNNSYIFILREGFSIGQIQSGRLVIIIGNKAFLTATWDNVRDDLRLVSVQATTYIGFKTGKRGIIDIMQDRSTPSITKVITMIASLYTYTRYTMPASVILMPHRDHFTPYSSQRVPIKCQHFCNLYMFIPPAYLSDNRIQKQLFRRIGAITAGMNKAPPTLQQVEKACTVIGWQTGHIPLGDIIVRFLCVGANGVSNSQLEDGDLMPIEMLMEQSHLSPLAVECRSRNAFLTLLSR